MKYIITESRLKRLVIRLEIEPMPQALEPKDELEDGQEVIMDSEELLNK